MTASRVSALIIAVFAFCASLTSQSFAQGDYRESGPMRLAPPKNLRLQLPKEPPAGGQTSQTGEQFAPRPAMAQPSRLNDPLKDVSPKQTSKIQVDSLQNIEPDAAGALSVEEGAFGAAMWTGASRAMVDSLLPRLPVGAASPTMRNLMRRLLLTTATPPKGAGKSGHLVALRATLLADMGDHAGVSSLLNATPGRYQNEPLVRIEADARFLANDNARACALASERINLGGDDYWQKAFIYCQILAGEKQKARLGLALLRELGEKDVVFLNLAEALINGDKTTIESLPDPSPLHLTMARTAKTPMPADVLSSSRPGVLSAIAVSPNTSVELRLKAAERAEATGALPTDVLRQLYSSVSFTKEDMANPLSKAETEGGSISRALLYRASLVQTVPTAQAEVVARALEIARLEGQYGSIARVFLPVLKRIPISRELVWFAPEAVRALLNGNNRENIAAWLSMLQENAMFNKESKAALVTLLPVARLAGLEGAKDWSTDNLFDWWNAVKEKDGGRKHAEMLYSLFETLGDPVPPELWNALIAAPGRTMMAMPNPAIWNRLLKATEIIVDNVPLVKSTKVMFGEDELGVDVESTQIAAIEEKMGKSLEVAEISVGEERLGETVLVSLLALGKGGPTQANPVTLRQVLSALIAAGLETEARALAVEAALAIIP